MRPRLLPATTLLLASALFGAAPAIAETEEPLTLKPHAASTEEVKMLGYEVILASDPRYFANTLGRFGLKPLAEEALAPNAERFRFLWLRSFHRPALFELRFAADGSGAYEAKLWEDAPDGGRWVVQRTVSLGAGALTEHRRSLERLGFFAMSFDDGRQGLDGATWLFEARDGERSHAVHRWSPEPGPLRQLGVSLIEAAIPSEFLPIY